MECYTVYNVHCLVYKKLKKDRIQTLCVYIFIYRQINITALHPGWQYALYMMR